MMLLLVEVYYRNTLSVIKSNFYPKLDQNKYTSNQGL